MANANYKHRAKLTAQQTIVTVGGTIAASNVFQIKVAGIVMAEFVATTTTISHVVAGLVAAWNAQEHPYARQVFATDEHATSAGRLRLTAQVAGPHFIITLSAAPGSSTFTTALSVRASSPYDAGCSDNWYDDGAFVPRTAVPADTADVLVFKGSDLPVLWGLADLSQPLADFVHYASFIGRIGLYPRYFAISADGTEVDTTVPEYRTTHLHVQLEGGDCGVGIPDGASLIGGGSPRVNLRIVTGANLVVDVHQDTSLGKDADDQPATNLNIENGNGGVTCDLNVLGGSGMVGVGWIGNETCALRNVYIGPGAVNQRVLMGPNTDFQDLDCHAGTGHECHHRVSTQDFDVRAGASLRLRKSGTKINSITAYGTVTVEPFVASGTEIGTVTVESGGHVDMYPSELAAAVVVDACTVKKGGSIKYDPGKTTFTALTLGASGIPHTVAIS